MKPPSACKFWLLTGVLFLALVINGISDTLRSVVYPIIDKALNLTYTQYGILQGMVQFSYLVWAFCIAGCVRYTGYKMGFIYVCLISITVDPQSHGNLIQSKFQTLDLNIFPNFYFSFVFLL